MTVRRPGPIRKYRIIPRKGSRITRMIHSSLVPLSAELFRMEMIAMMSRTKTRTPSNRNIAASFAGPGRLQLLRDRLLLREEIQVLAAPGLRVRARHVEAAEGVDPDEGARALAVQIQVA